MVMDGDNRRKAGRGGDTGVVRNERTGLRKWFGGSRLEADVVYVYVQST